MSVKKPRILDYVKRNTKDDPDHDAEILCKRITQSDWPWKFWGCRVFYYSRVKVVLSIFTFST